MSTESIKEICHVCRKMVNATFVIRTNGKSTPPVCQDCLKEALSLVEHKTPREVGMRK